MTGASLLVVKMQAAIDRGDLTGAASFAEDAIDIDADASAPRLLLAALAQHNRHWAVAAAHLSALAGDPAAAAMLGTVCVRMGRYADAIEPFRYAAEKGTDQLGSLLRLAWVYERLDQHDALLETIQRARPLAAARGVDLAVRTAILSARSAEWRAALAVLDSAPGLSGEDQLARGRLRDRAGRFSDAWGDFVSGKRNIAAQTGQQYPDPALAAHFAQLQRCFTPVFAQDVSRLPAPPNTPSPVFIAGAPRSGTTLLEAKLAGAQLAPRGELPGTFAMALRAAAIPGGYPGGLGSLGLLKLSHLAAELRRDYIASTDAAVGIAAAPRFIDKMPFNEQYLPLIALAFPEAPVVVVSRHPLDVLVSMMSHHMTHGYGCALDPLATATHIAAIDNLAEHWSRIGLPLLRQRYEDLVAHPSSELARIAREVGVEQQTDDARAPHIAATPSYSQVHATINARAVGRWRNYAPFLAGLAPIVSRIAERRGYELTAD